MIAIQRGEQLIFPEPSTEIHQADVVTALAPRRAEARLREALGYDAVSEEEAAEDQPMI